MSPETLAVTWVGHSTLLLQIGAVNVLTDPMWSSRASPVRFAGPKRLVPPVPALRDLPPIDVVLVSHNHYDHLDRRTAQQLARRYPKSEWIVPLRLERLMRRWGVARVRELDWWEEASVGGLTISGTPAQHFSARSAWDRGRTLWCGWAVRGPRHGAFFAGDTALHPEFRDIGERLGPFDVMLLPIGAYEPRWFMRSVHLNPEDAIEAYRQLVSMHPPNGAVVVPIHWGTFRLTDEALEEPPERFRACWLEAGLPETLLRQLRHGETAVLRDYRSGTGERRQGLGAGGG